MIEFKTTKEPTVKVNDRLYNDRLYMVRLHNEEMLLADVYGGSRKDAELKAELLAAAPLMLIWLQSLRKNYNIDEGDCKELDNLIGKFNV